MSHASSPAAFRRFWAVAVAGAGATEAGAEITARALDAAGPEGVSASAEGPKLSTSRAVAPSAEALAVVRSQPKVAVQVGPEKLEARARTATGAERAELWKQMVALYAPYEDYQKRTTDKVQKETDLGVSKVDEIVAAKEKEVMQV